MAVDIGDHYDILGVDRNADTDAIRSAWRRFARRHHPDVAKGRGAARRFIRIQEAYEVLSDPQRRRRYNAWLERISPSRPPHPRTATTRPPRTGAANGGASARHRGFQLDVLGIIQVGVEVGSAGVARAAFPPRRTHGR
jgi:DnaJ-class molecular chaperone